MAFIAKLTGFFETKSCLQVVRGQKEFYTLYFDQIFQTKTLLRRLHNGIWNWCIATVSTGTLWFWLDLAALCWSLGSYDEWTTQRHGKVTTLSSPLPSIMFLLDWLPKLQLKLFNSTMRSNGKVSAANKQIHVYKSSALRQACIWMITQNCIIWFKIDTWCQMRRLRFLSTLFQSPHVC